MLAPRRQSQAFIVRLALDCYADGVQTRAGQMRVSTRFAAGSSLDIDSAEKPSVHPSRVSGRTEEPLKSLEIFPFY
jgi:hypothetical protein